MTYANATRPCTFPGCTNSRHGATYCHGHERQVLDGRQLAPLQRRNKARDGMKRCGLCDEVKRVEDFGRKLHYHTEYCRECRNIKLRADTYGLTIDQVREMMTRTTCECCGGVFANTKDMHIDHCHRTGAVRGLLCQRCNVALGCVDDSVDHLRRLIAYVERA